MALSKPSKTFDIQGFEYPVRDIDPGWARDVAAVSRAGLAKWNIYMEGDFVSFVQGETEEGPWVHISEGRVYIDRELASTRVGGAWQLLWRLESTGLEGTIEFNEGRNEWTGRWGDQSWSGLRARRAGARGEMSLYCPLRRIPELRGAALRVPFPPPKPHPAPDAMGPVGPGAGWVGRGRGQSYYLVGRASWASACNPDRGMGRAPQTKRRDGAAHVSFRGGPGTGGEPAGSEQSVSLPRGLIHTPSRVPQGLGTHMARHHGLAKDNGREGGGV